jgi:hypothetical protein
MHARRVGLGAFALVAATRLTTDPDYSLVYFGIESRPVRIAERAERGTLSPAYSATADGRVGIQNADHDDQEPFAMRCAATMRRSGSPPGPLGHVRQSPRVRRNLTIARVRALLSAQDTAAKGCDMSVPNDQLLALQRDFPPLFGRYRKLVESGNGGRQQESNLPGSV